MYRKAKLAAFVIAGSVVLSGCSGIGGGSSSSSSAEASVSSSVVEISVTATETPTPSPAESASGSPAASSSVSETSASGNPEAAASSASGDAAAAPTPAVTQTPAATAEPTPTRTPVVTVEPAEGSNWTTPSDAEPLKATAVTEEEAAASKAKIEARRQEALNAVEYYLATDYWTYEELVATLEADGFSHSDAVWAMKNCSVDWEIPAEDQ